MSTKEWESKREELLKYGETPNIPKGIIKVFSRHRDIEWVRIKKPKLNLRNSSNAIKHQKLQKLDEKNSGFSQFRIINRRNTQSSKKFSYYDYFKSKEESKKLSKKYISKSPPSHGRKLMVQQKYKSTLVLDSSFDSIEESEPISKNNMKDFRIKIKVCKKEDLENEFYEVRRMEK